MQQCVTFAERDSKKSFQNIENRKIIDHCHYTGKYRGAVHIICNVRFKI